jgi:CTP:molybdopterin cytidylyltransferase MocA
MPDSLAALVLAAGEGRRLRPLSRLRPKALCPVAGRSLVDLAIAKVGAVVGTSAVAVNVHHGREQFVRHFDGRVHLSVEEPVALGTAGAVAQLRPWLDGRPVLVVNADTWHTAALAPLVADWAGTRVRVLICGSAGEKLGPASRVLGSVLPWTEVLRFPHAPWGLWEASWRDRLADGSLEVATAEADFVDCATPADYLSANLSASGGASVVGEGARVWGSVVRSVVWPGGVVGAGETLVDAIRVGERLTVATR